MDTGAWQAIVHAVLKSRTRLSDQYIFHNINIGLDGSPFRREHVRNYMTSSFFFFLANNEFSNQSRNLSLLSSSKFRRFHSHFSPRIVKHFPSSIHGPPETLGSRICLILHTKVSFPWVTCEFGLCILYFSEFFLARVLLCLGTD